MKKFALVFFMMFLSNPSFAKELSASKQVKNLKNKYTNLYEVETHNEKLFITQMPLQVSNLQNVNILGSSKNNEELKKVFLQKDKLLLVSSQIKKGQPNTVEYNLYVMTSSQLLKNYKIYFPSKSKVIIKENSVGIDIFSESDEANGTDKYTYRNGQLKHLTYGENNKKGQKLKKENECKTFYVVYTSFKKRPSSSDKTLKHSKRENSHSSDITHYDWLSQKVKNSPKLIEQLLKELTNQSKEERERVSYEKFKKIYCD